MKGRIIRANFNTKSFDFSFACCPGKVILRQTSNCSSLQSSRVSTSGQDLQHDTKHFETF